MSNRYKAQPDSPAHTVGGACQPPSKRGGYEPGTMWCCPTCKGIWYVDDHEWRFLTGSRHIQELDQQLLWTAEYGERRSTL